MAHACLLALALLGGSALPPEGEGQQPNVVENPFGTTINHFIYYVYVSLLGFFLYLRNEKFQKIVYGLFFLSVILEGFHFIIPNRSFQLGDLIGNILGVLVAYFVVKTYLLFKP
mgnify:CR=1 FL=1